MPWTPILKSPADFCVPPNLSDFAAARAAFSWDAAGRELDGLPNGQGLNIAYEAVTRHASVSRRDKVALRWIGKKGATRDLT